MTIISDIREEFADKRRRQAGRVTAPPPQSDGSFDRAVAALTAKRSAVTTLDQFMAGTPIHYSGYSGDRLTARYCTGTSLPYLEICDALTGKARRAPIMSFGEASAFYAGLEADSALLPAQA